MREKLTGVAWARCLAMAAVILMLAPGVWAQKNKKDKPPLEGQPMPALPVPASDEIDHNIGEMLGAFQVGNVEAMHKYYADNAVFVSGAYEPPMVGWQKYVEGYQRQRAAFQGMQLVRRNTVIFVHTDVAWASYQWEFASLYNNTPYTARGQTTLVLNKIGGNWLIVHNHTSQICDVAAPAAQPAPQQQPAQNQPASAPLKPQR
jgi:ketosteroid isomerase-like protein